jgi:hypothetical protein
MHKCVHLLQIHILHSMHFIFEDVTVLCEVWGSRGAKILLYLGCDAV